MINPALRVALLKQIASNFQEEYTREEIDDILDQYKLDGRAEYKGNKALYVTESLRGEPSATVESIAEDFNLIQDRGSVDDRETSEIWGEQRPRVFITHLAKIKNSAHRLADKLGEAGCSTFVAHDAIKPMKEWQNEIEKALRTADVLVAIFSENVVKSEWCNQEVGWALGRHIPIIPLRAGSDPHGFVKKFQGVHADKREVEEIAHEVFEIIARSELDSEIDLRDNIKNIIDLINEWSLESGIKYALNYLRGAIHLLTPELINKLSDAIADSKQSLVESDVLTEIYETYREKEGYKKAAERLYEFWIPF